MPLTFQKDALMVRVNTSVPQLIIFKFGYIHMVLEEEIRTIVKDETLMGCFLYIDKATFLALHKSMDAEPWKGPADGLNLRHFP